MIQILLLIILFALVTVAIAGRLGREWLICAIVVNLIVANIVGTQFFSFVGFEINVGNIFYAVSFFATQFFLEGEVSKKDRFFPLKIGGAFLFMYLVLSHGLSIFSAVQDGANASTLTLALAQSARITAASLIAFVFAQHGHIRIYLFLKERWGKRFLPLRSFIANTFAQFADSCIFFTVAFYDISASQLLQAILVGWMMKTLIVVIASPLLYGSHKKA